MNATIQGAIAAATRVATGPVPIAEATTALQTEERLATASSEGSSRAAPRVLVSVLLCMSYLRRRRSSSDGGRAPRA
jgi:hypothetical protein